jgi:hypothetical protein
VKTTGTAAACWVWAIKKSIALFSINPNQVMVMRNAFKQIRHDSNKTLTALFVAVIFICGVLAFAHPAHAISISERRKLAQLPKIKIITILNGKYFSELETFMLDQFPWRDHFLRIKAFNQFYIYRLKDNHNIFIKNGTAVAISYPFTTGADELAASKISALIDTYFQEMTVYVSIIPDKAYYLASQNGYPAIDYGKIQETILKGCAATYIDIFDTMTADDYYHTDSHWNACCPPLPVCSPPWADASRLPGLNTMTCTPSTVFTAASQRFR